MGCNNFDAEFIYVHVNNFFRYNEALKEVDVLIMPTMPYVATKLPPKDCSITGKIRATFNLKQTIPQSVYVKSMQPNIWFIDLQ